LLEARPEERNLWTGVFDRDIGDTQVMESEIVGAIAREIGIRSRAGPPATGARRPGGSREVYEAYLRGRYAITRGTPEGVQQGLTYLHAANERDPADPYPYVGLAIGYSILGHGPRPEVLPRAVAAAERALELDSTLAEPYAVLAGAKLYREWDWSGAEQTFRRALALNPALADARAHYAWYLDLLGPRDSALVEMRKAMESDPLDPLWPAWLASLYWSRGRFDEAIAEARKSLELNPDFAWGLSLLGRAQASQGLYREAIAAHERAASLNPEFRWQLAYTYALAGRTGEARRLVAELEANPTGMNLWGLPMVLAALGEKDRAITWLQREFDRRYPYAPWAGQNPALAPLRDDPRFQSLVARLHLPR
jgi:tetratricopeptide (TPR) repeat protein